MKVPSVMRVDQIIVKPEEAFGKKWVLISQDPLKVILAGLDRSKIGDKNRTALIHHLPLGGATWGFPEIVVPNHHGFSY